MRVLIIEDDPSTAAIVRRHLLAITEDIVVASDHAQAKAELDKRKPFDVITLDLCLPDSVPEETIKRIKEIKAYHPDCLLVVVSGYNMEAEALRGGADGFMSKLESIPSGVGFLGKMRDICMSVMRQPVRYQRKIEILEKVAEKCHEQFCRKSENSVKQ